MSRELRIGLVAEGPTDHIVLQSVISAILGARLFVLTLLQPEGSESFGTFGGGWAGVYRWCHQVVQRAGRLTADALLLEMYDILIVQVDADVASANYSNAAISATASDLPLPCALACPPADATANALGRVILSWCRETSLPARTVLCIPSKSTEAWVVQTLYPEDSAVVGGIECHPDPASRLQVQPASRRIRKRKADYLGKQQTLSDGWDRVVASQIQAAHFQRDLLDAIAARDAAVGGP